MMRRMATSRGRARWILGALSASALALPLACGGGGQVGPSAAAAKAGACGDAPRSAAECKGSGPESAGAGASASVPVKPGATKQEETAVERINDEIKKLSTEQARLCRDYASCAIDEEGFQKGTASVKQRMDSLPELIGAMNSAKTYGQKKRALDDLYRGVVPAKQRVEELTFRMGMSAVLPAGLGDKTLDVEPGAPLPTNARVRFTFEVTRDAYLYIFQKSPDGAVNVLFPDARIGTQNPLRASTPAEIPPNGQHFKLNDQDIGEENVYLVASREPIQSLDASLQRVKEGKVTRIGQDAVLRGLSGMQPGTAPDGCSTRALELEPERAPAPAPSGGDPLCTRTRGLVLAPDSASQGPKLDPALAGESAPSKMHGRAVMEVRTDPGDSVIVKVFPFKHVAEIDYPAAAREADKPAPGAPPGVKTRGIVIEL